MTLELALRIWFFISFSIYLVMIVYDFAGLRSERCKFDFGQNLFFDIVMLLFGPILVTLYYMTGGHKQT